MTEHRKEPSRVVAGLKAAVHNPNVSDEARQQVLERLKGMGEDVESVKEPSQPPQPQRARSPSPSSTRVLAGYKATLSNPYTSENAKRHAEEVLEAAGIRARDPDHTEEQHQIRVIAGYKAALHNSRVSDEAKQHARQYLEEHGVEA